MKKYFLLSLLAILTLTASAQTNTYAMVIEMQNGTKLTIGPNEVKNVTFNNGELTVTGETIETLVASAVNQAKEYTDQAAANLISYMELSNRIEQNAKNIIAQGKDITNLDDAIKAIKKALGDDTAETLKAYAKSIAENNALQAKLDAQGYADAQDAAQKLTLMQAIKDQADQDAKAWTAAMNLTIENLVTTYKLASLNEYIKTTAEAAQTAAEKNSKAYADTKDAAQSQTLIQTIKDQADQDAEAWTSAMNLSIENLVSTYQLNALTEIISARINEAIVNLIQTYNLQKP